MAPDFFENDTHNPDTVPFQDEPPLAQPVKIKNRHGCAFWIAIVGGIVAVGMLLIIVLFAILGNIIMPESPGRGVTTPSGMSFIEQTVEGSGQDKILLIPITGIITDGSQGVFGQGPSGMISITHEMLRTAQTDPDIKAVILTINSPGGGITASDVLHHSLADFRDETGLPVIALLGDVAASGGYYAASAADHIVAHPTTVTGSIGVIMNLVGVKDLMSKLGIEARPIKSGELKDIGSMSRDMTEKETQMLQQMVNEYQKRFVDVVSAGFKLRGIGMSRTELEKYCDGRVFSGGQAVEIGFADELGYLEDAIAAAQLKAGLSPESTRVITYQTRPSLFDLIMAQANTPKPNTLTLRIDGISSNESPQFLYLWTVGQPSLHPSIR